MGVEAIERYRRLAARRPDQNLNGLASALRGHAPVLISARAYDDAASANEEAINIYRWLVDRRPRGNLEWLAQTLVNQAVVLRNLGRGVEASYGDKRRGCRDLFVDASLKARADTTTSCAPPL